MTEQLQAELAAAQLKAADARDEIIRIETEIRKQSTLKTGDYVKITNSAAYEGQYARIVRLGRPTDLLPYHVKTIPYNISAQVYEVAAVPPAEIAAFLREVSEQLT